MYFISTLLKQKLILAPLLGGQKEVV